MNINLKCIQDFKMKDGEIAFTKGQSYYFEEFRYHDSPTEYKAKGCHWMGLADMEGYFDLTPLGTYTYQELIEFGEKCFKAGQSVHWVDDGADIIFTYGNFPEYLNDLNNK